MAVWYQKFPAFGDETMRLIRQTVDEAFLNFARDFGPVLESFFEPLRQFLIATEKGLLAAPWFVVLLALAALRAPVDAFFDGVMVNAEDPALRANRLGLLAKLHLAMNQVADLSKLSA